MSSRMPLSLLFLTMATLFLAACRDTPATPTPDPVTLNAAVETAIAATRTAEALIPTPTSVVSTLPSATAIASANLPTSTLTAPTPTTSPPVIPTHLVRCTVVAGGLNLRSGPGGAYEPPLGVIAAGTELTPLAFTPNGYPDGQWLQVQIAATGQSGWVSANPQLVTCNIELTTLPVGVAPPTPPPPTSTPAPIASAPTPTPTPPQRVNLPPDGGQSDLQGWIVLPGYSPNEVTYPMVFKDEMVIQVEVYHPNFGDQDGAGIDNVMFLIQRDDGDDTVLYERTEQTPSYCIFGGGEPTCNILIFAQTNNQWPETGQPIVDGPHRVFIEINQENGDTEQWNWGFEIEGALPQDTEFSNLTAQIVQTGPNSDADVVSDALVFQVFASTDGANDGAGIDRVDLRIIGPNGEVHQRTEQNVHYCAFGGGEPDCNIWDFAEQGYQWPNGDLIEPGDYTLRATVYAEDGNSTTVETNIQIQ